MSASSKTAIVSCPAPYGAGGLGQHLAEVVEELRGAQELLGYFCASPSAADLAAGIGWPIEDRMLKWRLNYTLARFDPGRRAFLAFDRFDRRVAWALNRSAGTFYGFAGAARESFIRARKLGISKLVLIAANSHVDNVVAQHKKAHARYPFESSWLNDEHVKKTLEEYRLADQICVASRYTEQSFLDRGFPASKLIYKPLTPNPRFAAASASRDRVGPTREDGVFRIVYVGSITVGKGIPILIEAFARFTSVPAELILVGGSSSRGMARYMNEALRKDPRIKVAPGDPLPHLLSAHVCVHSSWEDGFAYAPMEALASGLPVIVTYDTGMKDFVSDGVNGYIVRTGDVAELVDRLHAVASGALSRPESASAVPAHSRLSAR